MTSSRPITNRRTAAEPCRERVSEVAAPGGRELAVGVERRTSAPTADLPQAMARVAEPCACGCIETLVVAEAWYRRTADVSQGRTA